MRQNCMAVLLAGGQGSRLRVLTREIAKPAVPIGGNYRIIDFPLSNCSNSGIGTVGVLTQYQPHLLHSYIGSGHPWGLDGINRGVYILPPYARSEKSSWYTGTANSVYQNIRFIDRFTPEYVLILSGDHVYKMDYAPMLEQHIKNRADATIAVHPVSLEEASRFGILDCDASGRVVRFSEKPRYPESTLASMGVYIFSWSVLRAYLLEDNADPASSGDFGRDIIPKMLCEGRRLNAHMFHGYWKDVGTIESLWETNMDILSPNSGLDLFATDMKVYYRNSGLPPCYADINAQVTASLFADGARISGEVDHSVISTGVTIGKGARVCHSVIMPGAHVEEGAEISYSIVAENARIGRYAQVGSDPLSDDLFDWGIAVVGEGCTVGEDCCIPPNYVLENDVTESSVCSPTDYESSFHEHMREFTLPLSHASQSANV